MDKEVKYQVIECVPWQVCPLCQGTGQGVTVEPNYTGFHTGPCSVCNGAKVIPMYVIPKPKIKYEKNTQNSRTDL